VHCPDDADPPCAEHDGPCAAASAPIPPKREAFRGGGGTKGRLPKGSLGGERRPGVGGDVSAFWPKTWERRPEFNTAEEELPKFVCNVRGSGCTGFRLAKDDDEAAGTEGVSGGDHGAGVATGLCSGSDVTEAAASLHSLHLPFLRPCSQIEDPPHSLQILRRRLWMQIEAPPHWMQCRRSLLCAHTEVPTHSRHSFFRRLCSQIDDPLHCLQRRRSVLCSQIEEPPQSMHSRLRRPCSHIDAPLQSLHSFLRLS